MLHFLTGYTPNAINGVTSQGVTLVNGVPLTAQNFMEQARIETGSRSLQTLVERNPEVFRYAELIVEEACLPAWLCCLFEREISRWTGATCLERM